MDRKIALTTIIIFLASLVAIMQTVDLAEANPASMAKLFDAAVIDIQSPQNGTYNVKTISLNFTVETNNEYQASTYYILNGSEPVEVKTTAVSTVLKTGTYGYPDSEGNIPKNYTFHYERYNAEGHAVLSNLADGSYNLTIQRYLSNPREDVKNATVIFTIDLAASFTNEIQSEIETLSTPSPMPTESSTSSPVPSPFSSEPQVQPPNQLPPKPSLSESPLQSTQEPNSTAFPASHGIQAEHDSPVIIILIFSFAAIAAVTNCKGIFTGEMIAPEEIGKAAQTIVREFLEMAAKKTGLPVTDKKVVSLTRKLLLNL